MRGIKDNKKTIQKISDECVKNISDVVNETYEKIRHESNNYEEFKANIELLARTIRWKNLKESEIVKKIMLEKIIKESGSLPIKDKLP